MILKEYPIIVCLCGSTKFKDTFIKEYENETLEGRIVLSVGIFNHANNLNLSKDTEHKLDELHKRKIDLADEVLFLNKNGYLGDSTIEELNYTYNTQKKIRFLEPPDQEGDNRLIQVCIECYKASCWMNINPCDKHGYVSIYKTVRQLKELNKPILKDDKYEDEIYWRTDEQNYSDLINDILPLK